MLINFNDLLFSIPGLDKRVGLPSRRYLNWAVFSPPLSLVTTISLCGWIALAGLVFGGARGQSRQSRPSSQRRGSQRQQNWISSTLLLSKQTKLMGLLFLLPSNYWVPVERIWQHKLTQILILLIPSIHINLTSTWLHYQNHPGRQCEGMGPPAAETCFFRF